MNAIHEIDVRAKALAKDAENIQRFKIRTALEGSLEEARDEFFKRLKASPSGLNAHLQRWSDEIEALRPLIEAAPKMAPPELGPRGRT